MKMLNWVIAALMLSSTFLAAHVKAQQMLGPNPNIGGIPMMCGGAIAYVVPAGSIGDIARALPGQILLDQRFFQFPPLVQRFIYAHECAHQLVGLDETAADCTAIRFGKQQGWLPPAGLRQVQQIMGTSMGDWSHLPGPARIQQMEICYQSS